MKNKNLLIICPSFPDKENQFYGGIFVKEYINSIKEFFNKVYVISPIPSIYLIKTNKEKICKDYKYDNIEIYYPKHFHLPIKYFRDRIGNNQFKVVDKLIKKLGLKIDIIHSHFIWPSGYVGVKLKEIYKKKLIITGHGYDVYELPFRNTYWNNKIKNILKLSDFITTVSKSNEKKLNKLGFNNIKIIPNGYSEKDFFYRDDKKELKLELNIYENKKILLTVGNLVKQKNHKILILGCKKLLKIRTDFICYIIGDGIFKNKLEKLIIKNKLGNHIKLLGKKKHKEIAKYIHISDLFILPSISESFGVVQIEAMACGLPVIATINGGSEEIISNNNYGFLLKDKNDFMGLSKLIEKGLNKKWDKEKIINYVVNNFSQNKINKEYINIFNKM